MKNLILQKLDELKAKSEELKKKLSDPEVFANRAECQRYAKELSRVSPIVKKYIDFLNVQEQITQTEELLKHEKEQDLVKLAEDELTQLRAASKKMYAQLEDLVIEDDPEANRDVIVEVRAGTGGLEATLFAADIYRMYSKFAARRGWKVDILNSSPSEAGGVKEIIFSLEGEYVYKWLKYESGVHRVQRVPTTETSGRIHTSAISVAVLPEAEEVDIQIDPKDLKIDVFRATGPGGQGVNTTDSAVRITYLPTNTVVSCQDERSQMKNKAKAMKVLRARLFDQAKQKQQQEIAASRKTQIGTGDRSEKIRTYNFPQRRVTDHRIGFSVHNLGNVLEGELDEIILALATAEKKLKTNGIAK